jgi:hypothetical protein
LEWFSQMHQAIGMRNGKGLRITALMALNMAVFAPIPSARVATITSEKPGGCAKVRNANRRSGKPSSSFAGGASLDYSRANAQRFWMSDGESIVSGPYRDANETNHLLASPKFSIPIVNGVRRGASGSQ